MPPPSSASTPPPHPTAIIHEIINYLTHILAELHKQTPSAISPIDAYRADINRRQAGTSTVPTKLYDWYVEQEGWCYEEKKELYRRGPTDVQLELANIVKEMALPLLQQIKEMELAGKKEKEKELVWKMNRLVAVADDLIAKGVRVEGDRVVDGSVI